MALGKIVPPTIYLQSVSNEFFSQSKVISDQRFILKWPSKSHGIRIMIIIQILNPVCYCYITKSNSSINPLSRVLVWITVTEFDPRYPYTLMIFCA